MNRRVKVGPGESAMSVDSVIAPPKRSIAGLIGWLSACLLAAGWGPRLNFQLRDQWVLIGSFGLAAALGIEFSNRLRFSSIDEVERTPKSRRNARRRPAPQRAARIPAEAPAQPDPLAGVADALRRICQDRHLRHGSSAESPADPKTLFSESIVVRHLQGPSLGTEESAATMNAQVRNISRDGIRLLHKERIGSPRFLLPFVLSGGETIPLLVELQWQHQLADGFYHSGGKWLKVATDDCVADLAGGALQERRRSFGQFPATALSWLSARLG
jgi:hypothetical protein